MRTEDSCQQHEKISQDSHSKSELQKMATLSKVVETIAPEIFAEAQNFQIKLDFSLPRQKSGERKTVMKELEKEVGSFIEKLLAHKFNVKASYPLKQNTRSRSE